MKKMMNLVGVLALVLLLIQSTIGIINYSSTGTPQGFPDRGSFNAEGGNGFGGTPTQNTEEGTNSTNSSAQEKSIVASSQNGQMQMNRGPQDSSLSTALRSIENGIPGLVINCLSLGLGIVWILLFFLTRKKQQSLVA
ncbi:hypothetical protein CJ195_10440 [Bacillus sp. UMB0899]|nr:hypothetical protein CJ195_10440 [Bacillus sp. UMB0899]